jgi:hypothetical protein
VAWILSVSVGDVTLFRFDDIMRGAVSVGGLPETV